MAVVLPNSGAPARVESRGLYSAASIASSRWMLAVILLLAFVAYAPTLNDWFVGDDFWFLRASRSTSVWDYAVRVVDPRQTSFDGELNRYRPLYPLAWRLQYEVFGMEAMPYHAVVLGLHLVTVVLAWFIFRRLLLPAFPSAGAALSNLATIIFALHPAYADAIGWVSGGNRVFTGLPYAAALLLFMKSLDPGERRPWITYGGALAAYMMAILMHSSAITLVLVLPLYTFLISAERAHVRHWRSWLQFVPFAIVASGMAALQAYEREHIGSDSFSFGFHQFSNYGWYFGVLVVPVETAIETSRLENIAEKIQLVASVVLIGCTAAVVFRRPANRLAIFAAAWFVLALLPDSTYVGEQAGRMLYAPGIAGALMIVVLLAQAQDALPRSWERRVVSVAPYVVAASIVPVALVAYARTRGTSELALDNKAFADALAAKELDVSVGGILYVSGAPGQGTALPSQQIALVLLSYPESKVELLAPGQEPPKLGAGDHLFVYTP